MSPLLLDPSHFEAESGDIEERRGGDASLPGETPSMSPPLNLDANCEPLPHQNVATEPPAGAGGAAAAAAAAAGAASQQETGALRTTKKRVSFAFGHAGQGALVVDGAPERPLLLVDCVVRGFRIDVLLLPRSYVRKTGETISH